MNTKDLTAFRDQFPVVQDTRTGKWGWRRVLGCIDLRACDFGTAEEARADRDATIRRGQYDPETGQPS